MYFVCLKKAERSLRLVGDLAPTPRRATSTNLQSSVFNIKFADLQGQLFPSVISEIAQMLILGEINRCNHPGNLHQAD